MECYEGAKMIKTFRGLVPHGGQDTIVLHTNDGSTGYRIVKFQVINSAPGVTSYECITKIYKVKQSTVSGAIDFNDNTLLGAAYWGDHSGVGSGTTPGTIIFESEIFNQDIYITTEDESGNAALMNYYIELEQIKLDLSENSVATLKDIRNLS